MTLHLVIIKPYQANLMLATAPEGQRTIIDCTGCFAITPQRWQNTRLTDLLLVLYLLFLFFTQFVRSRHFLGVNRVHHVQRRNVHVHCKIKYSFNSVARINLPPCIFDCHTIVKSNYPAAVPGTQFEVTWVNVRGGYNCVSYTADSRFLGLCKRLFTLSDFESKRKILF